jgi:hypothetical protein
VKSRKGIPGRLKIFSVLVSGTKKSSRDAGNDIKRPIPVYIPVHFFRSLS